MRQLHRLGRMPHAACAALALTPTFGYTRARAASLRRGDPCFTSLRYNPCGNPRLGGETGRRKGLKEIEHPARKRPE